MGWRGEKVSLYPSVEKILYFMWLNWFNFKSYRSYHEGSTWDSILIHAWFKKIRNRSRLKRDIFFKYRSNFITQKQTCIGGKRTEVQTFE